MGRVCAENINSRQVLAAPPADIYTPGLVSSIAWFRGVHGLRPPLNGPLNGVRFEIKK